MLLSKYYRVAIEGQTTDGRKITRDWINQMADGYNRTKYGARIWLEHVRGLFADSAFPALGDVHSVEARDVDIDGETRRALYAQLAPTDQLVAMNQKKQKIFTSIEVDPDFAGTGQAYLVGLGVTDSPASLGTEALEFSAKHPNVFAGRKQRPENLLSEAMESELDFTEQADDTPPDTSALFNKVKTLLGLDNKKNDQKFADQAQAIELLANQVAELGKQEVPSADNTQYTTIKAAHDQLQADFAAFKTQMEGEDKPKKFTRQAAAGGTGQALADC